MDTERNPLQAMVSLVGQRVVVATSRGQELGTYVWEDIIFLDSGRKIDGRSHRWKRAPNDGRLPAPISVRLRNRVRIFFGTELTLNDSKRMSKGDTIVIARLERKKFNNQTFLVGRLEGEEERWVLIGDITMPVLDMA